ncbi:LysR family transcriptional regulator [Oceanisphaera psychrotolerans]|uniref:HTH lysR-type domain-containing protein n=1 Tax=Oceanisphaera psychrotolerans TaxID=1414654 RepID=A0A1J4QF28_9GAMM|nr:LysR family transcriptional regulator [Oceanisphaera psychrotolerans]OIN09144.1 hypothetical protein BFR47_02395 [Oceanisphaera psychrotolerans]
MKRPPPHNWLFVFKVIVESGSITEASERLNVSQSAVSQQLKSLEDYLGSRLIIRGKKGIVLTDVGKHYFNIIKISLDRISLATEQLFGFEHKNTITIKSNYSFVDVWLSRNISDFHKRHPGVSVEIYTMLWLSDFRDVGSEIEIRYGDGSWSDLKCHQLTNDRVFPVCSPSLKEKINKPEDILDYPLISVMGNKTGWAEWFLEQGIRSDIKPSSLYVESNLLAYKASAEGDYITLGINSLVDNFIKDGSLIKLEYGDVKSRENFFLLEPNNYCISEKDKTFIEWITSNYKQEQ